MHNPSTFLWLFKVLCFVLQLKFLYQEQTALYYHGTSVRSCFLFSASTQVTCNIRSPPKLQYDLNNQMWQVSRCTEGCGSSNQPYSKRRFLAAKYCASKWETPCPVSIKEVLLLMLYQLPSPGHSTFFFTYACQYRPRKKTQKEVEDLKLTVLSGDCCPCLLTLNHGLILSSTGLYQLLSNIICLTKGSTSKHVPETSGPNLWEPFSCR